MEKKWLKPELKEEDKKEDFEEEVLDEEDEEEEKEVESSGLDITDFRLFGDDDMTDWQDIVDSFCNDDDDYSEDLQKLFEGLNTNEKK